MKFKFAKITQCYGLMYVVICMFIYLFFFCGGIFWYIFFGHWIKSDASELLVIFLTHVNEIFISIYECCLLCYSIKSVKNIQRQYVCNFYLIIYDFFGCILKHIGFSLCQQSLDDFKIIPLLKDSFRKTINV